MNRLAQITLSLLTALALTACDRDSGKTGTAGGGSGGKPLTVGFSQVGAESSWRTAETQSIQDEPRSATST